MPLQAEVTAAEHMDLLQKLKDPQVLKDLTEDAVVWATQHGLVMGLATPTPAAAVVHAPLALTPVPFPAGTFREAEAAAGAFAALVDAVAEDDAYLLATLRPTAAHDDFVARQLALLEATAGPRAAHRGSQGVLAHLRSDYMLHTPTGSLLQVEINTIGVSFACLGGLTARLHGHLLGRLGAGAAERAALPPNDALDQLADALGAAAQAYGVEGAVVVMVVQPGERNLYDQQWAQTRLWERHGVRTLRRTLSELARDAELGADRRLRVGGAVAAVVYFRAGYVPEDYSGEAEWAARERVERSDAFKCPSVAYQLAGAKKVQQDLARPGQVERFLPDAAQAALVRRFFAGLWGLEDLADPDTAAAVGAALRDPGAFVLKPQREGGGHNLYGAELRARLERGGPGLGAYVLMQRILPPINRSVMVRGGEAVEADTLSELGIFSVLVRRGGEVLVSRGAGHLVRTKAAESDEGGVAAGYGVLDSPFLV